jgi:hypothetical protein
VDTGGAFFPQRCEPAPSQCGHCGGRCKADTTKKKRQYIDATWYTYNEGPLMVRMYRSRCQNAECGHLVYSKFSQNKAGGVCYYGGEVEDMFVSSPQSVFSVDFLEKLENDMLFSNVTFTAYRYVTPYAAMILIHICHTATPTTRSSDGSGPRRPEDCLLAARRTTVCGRRR